MKLYFQKLGKGPPMVILHGLFGSSDNWISIARKLADYYTVYIVDQRNHGRSPHDESNTYKDMVDDLYELLVSEDIAKIHLVGHSMGGKTAMLFGSMYPVKITSLTVIDIAPDSYSDQTGRSPQVLTHLDIINVMFSVHLDQGSSRTEIDKLLSYKIPDFTTRQFILKNLNRNPDNSFSWRLNLVAIKNALPQIMASIPVSISEAFPVCFVKGEYSNYLTGVHLASIKSYFPNFKLINVPGAGHWVHYDKPDLLIEVLKLT